MRVSDKFYIASFVIFLHSRLSRDFPSPVPCHYDYGLREITDRTFFHLQRGLSFSSPMPSLYTPPFVGTWQRVFCQRPLTAHPLKSALRHSFRYITHTFISVAYSRDSVHNCSCRPIGHAVATCYAISHA